MNNTVLLIPPRALAAIAGRVATAPFDESRVRVLLAKKLMSLLDALELTDDQRETVRTMVESYKRDISTQLRSDKAARDGMRAAVEAHGADSAEAKAAARKVGAIATRRALLMAEIVEEMKPFLTEGQIEKIEKGQTQIAGWIEGQLSAKGF